MSDYPMLISNKLHSFRNFQIQGDNKLFQHVVHILYVQSLLQGKYPVNSEEMELFNHSLSELMTSKMNDFINFLN